MKSLNWNIMRFDMREMVKEVVFSWASYTIQIQVQMRDKHYHIVVYIYICIMFNVTYVEYVAGMRLHAVCFLAFIFAYTFYSC